MNRMANEPSRHKINHSIDASIDCALTALRDAQPRSGSEPFAGRILHALETRAASRQRPTWQRLLSLPVITWTTAACVLAVTATLLLTHTFHERRSTEARTIATRVAHPFANAKGWGREPTQIALSDHRHPERSAHGVPGQLAGWGRARSRRSPVFENCRDHPSALLPSSAGCPIHDDGAAVGMGRVAQIPTDAQALADLHAPSHPAPPLPLTPQEKALLRMLNRSNAVEIASLSDLDPVIRAARDAREAAAFHAFFPDPPPIPQPNGDTE